MNTTLDILMSYVYAVCSTPTKSGNLLWYVENGVASDFELARIMRTILP